MSFHVSAVGRRFCPGCTSPRCPSSPWVTGYPWCCTTGAACHVTASLPRLLSPPRVRAFFFFARLIVVWLYHRTDARSSISTLHLSYHLNYSELQSIFAFFSTHNKWLNLKVPFCCCAAFKSVNCITQRPTLQPKPCRSAFILKLTCSIINVWRFDRSKVCVLAQLTSKPYH